MAEEISKESAYRALRHLGDPVIGYAADGTCRYLNDAAAATLTRPLLGLCVWEVYPDLRGSDFGEAFEEALRTHGPVRYRSRYAPTGMEYEATLVSEGDEVVVVFRDLTEMAENARRTRQVAALAQASELLASGLETEAVLRELMRLVVPELADWCAVDLFEGERLRRISVADRDPTRVAIGYELAERWPVEPGRSSVTRRVLAGEVVVMRQSDGSSSGEQAAREPEDLERIRRLGLEAVIACPLSGPERVFGVLCFGFEGTRRFDDTDVTVAKELARRAATALHLANVLRQLREERDRAEEAVRGKDDFLAVLGHELRNPLAPIRTAIEVLAEDPRLSSAPELAIVDRQLRHVTQLVDDLLDVSRITRGTLELMREPTAVADAVRAAIEMASPLVEQRRHTLDVRVSDDAWVDGDPRRLAQIFANLLTNAARYTPPGGNLTVASRGEGGWVEVLVRDDGRGISPSSLPRLFRAFARVDPEGTDGGLGLGLSIVRNLVEKHGGQVRLESEGLGRGTTAVVRLPLLAPERRVRRRRSSSVDRLAKAGTRLLLVDDNEDAALLLASSLRRRGFAVTVAHDGPAALELVEQLAPHVAILDLGLPVMDGVELGTRIRERLGDGAPALVALTGYGQRGARERTAAAGFVHHLVKPVQIAQLTELLAGLARAGQ